MLLDCLQDWLAEVIINSIHEPIKATVSALHSV